MEYLLHVLILLHVLFFFLFASLYNSRILYDQDVRVINAQISDIEMIVKNFELQSRKINSWQTSFS